MKNKVIRIEKKQMIYELFYFNIQLKEEKILRNF
jgi:hypothetical protein